MLTFVGLREQDWIWTSLKPVTYTNWGPGEPNRHHELCTTTERPYQYRWADIRCSRLEPYICKAPCPGQHQYSSVR